jgi:hypothetical protein
MKKTLTEKVIDGTKNVMTGLVLTAIAVPVLYTVKKMYGKEVKREPTGTRQMPNHEGYDALTRDKPVYEKEQHDKYEGHPLFV